MIPSSYCLESNGLRPAPNGEKGIPAGGGLGYFSRFKNRGFPLSLNRTARPGPALHLSHRPYLVNVNQTTINFSLPLYSLPPISLSCEVSIKLIAAVTLEGGGL